MDHHEIKTQLEKSNNEASLRGLRKSFRWSSELIDSLIETINSSPDAMDSDPDGDVTMTVDEDDDMTTSQSTRLITIDKSRVDGKYLPAKSCYDEQEFERGASYAKASKCPEGRFLYYYCRYLAAEKKLQDFQAESSPAVTIGSSSAAASGSAASGINNGGLTTSSTSNLTTNISSSASESSLALLKELRKDLQKLVESGTNDSYILYVFGIVLHKLDLHEDAATILVKSIQANFLNWSAWHQLAVMINDESRFKQLAADLPAEGVWIRRLFEAIVFQELQMNEEAMTIYEDMKTLFGTKCPYIMTQMAIAQQNSRDFEGAIETFKEVRKLDPFRLDSIDIYSNLLYVKDLRVDLSILAHSVNSIDPFRVESCCVIGNFYSLRGQHAKAVVYFMRALQLNPKHLSAWTLMGHEYMELKNTTAAIQAYRSAIRCNKRDYRAWYGLGQTYEILKMDSYALYYYNMARSLKPNDMRMQLALTETLDRLKRN